MKFDGWSTEALRGYVVMLGEFMSGSMQEDPQRAAYVDRLSSAQRELKAREDAESGRKASVAFPTREVVVKEEPDATS